MRTAFFQVVKQPVVVIPNRPFGTTYWSHLQGFLLGVVVILGFLTLEDGTDRLSRNIGKELQLLAE